MTTVHYTNRWKSGRLAMVFAENKIKNSTLTSTDALQFRYGEIRPKPFFELTDDLIETYRKYAIVRPDDIMLNGLNLNYDFVTQRVARVMTEGIITSAYISLRPREGVSVQYYTYLLKTLDAMKIFNGMGTGIRLTLSYNLLRNLELPLPPREEQDQIVRYLDWQVSKINKLIAAKKKQIVLLKTRKQTVVNEAVTKGLNPNVPMKDSGVEWIGVIPAHWNIIKLGSILKPISVKNHPELPLLSVVREQGVIVRNVEDSESNHNFIPDDLSNYKVVYAGQFAMNKMKAWQGSYGMSQFTGIVSPAYFIFNVSFENTEYFHYAIRSKVYVNFFAQASDGIRVGQWDLDIHKMKEIPFIVPPSSEQAEIVACILNAFDAIEKVIEVIGREIELLKELRIRLISDVVTGQIDVRGIEVPDFELVEECAENNEEELEEIVSEEE